MLAVSESEQSLTRLEAALKALDRGWSILPVSPQSKHPAVKFLPEGKWKPYQSTLPKRETVCSWFEENPMLKFGHITGKVSNIVVLDIDSGGEESLKGKELPPTVCAQTPSGGYHHYYKHPGCYVSSKANILPNVDIRGDGGYAIAPAEGTGYTWVEGGSPDEMMINDMPNWLESLVKREEDDDNTLKDSYISPLKPPLYRLLGTNPENEPVLPITNVRGDWLKEWFKREDVAFKAAHLFSIPNFRVGKTFCCILPGHRENNPSASIAPYLSNGSNGFKGDGIYRYRDWHSRSDEERYLLGDVYAFLHYGKVFKLSSSESATWHLRLLVDAGVLKPSQFKAPELPCAVKPAIKKVYEGFLHLFRCKWLHTFQEPSSFSRIFAAAWCGVTERIARGAINELIKMGYMCLVDECTTSAYKTRLFLPPGYH